MRVTTIGHAGLRIDSSEGAVLCDPWFSPEGAFLGAWHQFPDNSHLCDVVGAGVNAVVISHEHFDHLDPWFLSRLSDEVTVFIPDYPSPVLREKARRSGRRVEALPPWTFRSIAPGIELLFVPEPPMNHDAAMVLRVDGRIVLNSNDARLFGIQIRELRTMLDQQIDLLAFQGAGASWYPMCYRLPADTKLELSAQKRRAKLAYCRRLLRLVDPAVAVPFAGPPVFLDPDLESHNREMDGGIFPDQLEVLTWLRRQGFDNVQLGLPGDVFDLRTQERVPDPYWSDLDLSLGVRAELLEQYATRRRPFIEAVRARHPTPAEPLWPAFSRWAGRILSLSEYFNDKIGYAIGFEVSGPGGGAWTVDFRRATRGVRASLDVRDCAYVYYLEGRWLPPVFAGELTWEDFLLSLRFSASRTPPDLYNDHHLGLLKFAEVEALAAVEEFESAQRDGELVEVRSKAGAWSVSRYCPHAGNDLLETGEVVGDRVLRCLAHHYDFDLASGRCLNADCSPIEVRPSVDRGQAE